MYTWTIKIYATKINNVKFEKRFGKLERIKALLNKNIAVVIKDTALCYVLLL